MDDERVVYSWGNHGGSPQIAFSLKGIDNRETASLPTVLDGTISVRIFGRGNLELICIKTLFYNSASALEARGVLKPEKCKDHQLFFPARRFKKINNTDTYVRALEKLKYDDTIPEKHDRGCQRPGGAVTNPLPGVEHTSWGGVCPQVGAESGSS